MSKLAELVRLYTSKVYLRLMPSLILVIFTSEISARFCQACRKMLRWPFVKSVSKVSPAGTAENLGLDEVTTGTLKQAGLSAGALLIPKAPEWPVSAFFGEQAE